MPSAPAELEKTLTATQLQTEILRVAKGAAEGKTVGTIKDNDTGRDMVQLLQDIFKDSYGNGTYTAETYKREDQELFAELTDAQLAAYLRQVRIIGHTATSSEHTIPKVLRHSIRVRGREFSTVIELPDKIPYVDPQQTNTWYVLSINESTEENSRGDIVFTLNKQ